MTSTIKRSLLLFTLIGVVAAATAQRLIGTTGLMNIPTADMNPAATFDGGVRYFQKEVSEGVYDFDTGIYYISFTPFSFIELTFRETLLKTQHSRTGKWGYYQQDRSTTIRLRPIAERAGKWYPSIVVGCNDIYSAYGASLYAALYGAATKHLELPHAGRLGVTLGYARAFNKGKMYDGVFAGIDYAPLRNDRLHLTAEYDTQGLNLGASYRLWNSFQLFAFTHDLRGCAAGVSYLHTIKF